MSGPRNKNTDCPGLSGPSDRWPSQRETIYHQVFSWMHGHAGKQNATPSAKTFTRLARKNRTAPTPCSTSSLSLSPSPLSPFLPPPPGRGRQSSSASSPSSRSGTPRKSHNIACRAPPIVRHTQVTEARRLPHRCFIVPPDPRPPCARERWGAAPGRAEPGLLREPQRSPAAPPAPPIPPGWRPTRRPRAPPRYL